MKGGNTAEGQCIWICGSIPNMEHRLIRLYLGCDKCGTKSNEDIGTKYKCSNSRCHSTTAISTARMTFAFDLVDISGSWNMTLFSSDAVKVLGIEPEALYNMEYQDRENFYAEAAELLTKNPSTLSLNLEHHLQQAKS